MLFGFKGGEIPPFLMLFNKKEVVFVNLIKQKDIIIKYLLNFNLILVSFEKKIKFVDNNNSSLWNIIT